jgi:hypothetical protein
MPYAIRMTRQFYGPKTIKSWVTDNNMRAQFVTRNEAQAVCDALDGEPYHLGHNESSRPDFTPVRVYRPSK